MYLRVTLFDEDVADQAFVTYEHAHFAADGIVTRSQLVKLVRAIAQSIAERHDEVKEMVACGE